MQLRYDTHAVKAKHASIDAPTPQESCSKICPTDLVSQRRKDDLSGHHQGHVGSLYIQWIMPTEAKAPDRKKGKEYTAGQDNYG